MWFILLHAAGICYYLHQSTNYACTLWPTVFISTDNQYIYDPRNRTYRISSERLNSEVYESRRLTFTISLEGGIFDGFFVCLRVTHPLNRTQQIKRTDFCHSLLDKESSLEQRVVTHLLKTWFLEWPEAYAAKSTEELQSFWLLGS